MTNKTNIINKIRRTVLIVDDESQSILCQLDGTG